MIKVTNDWPKMLLVTYIDGSNELFENVYDVKEEYSLIHFEVVDRNIKHRTITSKVSFAIGAVDKIEEVVQYVRYVGD